MKTKIKNHKYKFECSKTSAKKFIEDFEKGVFKFGNQKEQINEEKNNKTFFIVTTAIVLFLIYFFIFEFNRNKITGFVVSEKSELIKNSKITFQNVESNTKYYCKTDDEAKFTIKIPRGNYNVYKNNNEKSLKVNVEDSSNLRVTIFE